jgi:hypothetical protein
MRLALEVFFITAIPFGTAVLFGAIADRLGAKAMSGFVAIGGLGLGTYFLSYVLESIVVR